MLWKRRWMSPPDYSWPCPARNSRRARTAQLHRRPSQDTMESAPALGAEQQVERLARFRMRTDQKVGILQVFGLLHFAGHKEVRRHGPAGFLVSHRHDAVIHDADHDDRAHGLFLLVQAGERQLHMLAGRIHLLVALDVYEKLLRPLTVD